MHPGGPYWARKDSGAWSIPKGELDEVEELRACALREFAEETGVALPPGELADLGAERLERGKRVHAFAVEGDLDAATVRSNTFELEWPPRSGQTRSFPEVDRAAWFDTAEARRRIVPAQSPFLAVLERLLG